MTCNEALERLPEEHPEVADHLRACEACRAAAEAYEWDAIHLIKGLRSATDTQKPAPPAKAWQVLPAAAASILVLAVTFWTILRTPEPIRQPGGFQETSPSEEKKLITQLGSDDIQERERAAQELERKGKEVLPLLERELGSTQDVEIRLRLKQVIDRLTRPSFELLKEIRGCNLVGAWSPDGNRFARAAFGSTDQLHPLTIYNRDWKEIAKATPSEDPAEIICGLAYSPDGKLIGVRNCTSLTIYTADDLKVVFTTNLNGKMLTNWGLSFLNSNTLLFQTSHGLPFAVAVREQGSWTVKKKGMEMSGSGYWDVSPGGTWLAFPQSLSVAILNTETWAPVASIEKPGLLSASSVAFSPNSKFLAGCWGEGRTFLFQTVDWKSVRSWLPNGTNPNVQDPTSFCFSHDSKYIFTSGLDGWLRAWHCETGEEVASTQVDRRGVRIFASPKENLIFYSGSDNKSKIFRLREPLSRTK